MGCVYFDNNASAPPLEPILDALRPALDGGLGNAGSVHRRGQAAKAALDAARGAVAELIGAHPGEIVFTGGGTESDNLAIFGAVAEWSARHPGAAPAHLITSRIEHHAVLNAFEELERRGHPVSYIPASHAGVVDPADVRDALRPDTALISVMMANNETGVLQPVAEIGALARDARVRFHVDAVQAVGKVPVRVTEIACDLLSLSGHKLHALPGVGALYLRKGVRIHPLLFGGRQERQRRAGSENVPGIVSLGAAAQLALDHADGVHLARLARLRDRLEAGVLAAVPDCAVTGAGEARVPNTSNISFDGIESEALVIALDLHGFCVSAGAACSSGAVEPSHVLLGMGYSRRQARSCVRFSLGRQNTQAEVDALLAILPELVQRQRRLAAPLRAERSA